VTATVVIAKVVDFAFSGLRVTEEEESQGLDVVEHGEEGYIIE
jgi:ammonia channel protein AmtB